MNKWYKISFEKSTDNVVLMLNVLGESINSILIKCMQLRTVYTLAYTFYK